MFQVKETAIVKEDLGDMVIQKSVCSLCNKILTVACRGVRYEGMRKAKTKVYRDTISLMNKHYNKEH